MGVPRLSKWMVMRKMVWLKEVKHGRGDSALQQVDGEAQESLVEEENTAVVFIVIALTELAEAKQVIRTSGDVKILVEAN